MPELPEVETVRRELEPWLKQRTILSARRRDAPAGPKYARLEEARGETILAVGRRGKFLLLPLSGGCEMVIHLGMTGVLTPSDPGNHVRVVVELEGAADATLFFQDTRRFGRFLLVPQGDYRSLPTLQKMGPEPLDGDFSVDAFAAALARSNGPIKTLLMSQRPVAGVGNIYADESLWRARVHPLSRSSALSRPKIVGLRNAIVEVLTASVAAQGTTINDYRTVSGSVGAYLDELAVYGHKGDPCQRCRKPIRKIVVGQRSTWFCPSCQRRRA